MKTIMAKNPHDSFSFSSRYFHWKKKSIEGDEDDDMEEILNFSNSNNNNSRSTSEKDFVNNNFPIQRSLSTGSTKPPKKKLISVSKLRAALTLGRTRTRLSSGLGTKVVGTLFGHRRGHVQFAFQDDFKQSPSFFVELATPTSVLVKEMASGLVRIALECDKKKIDNKKSSINGGFKLLEEPIWRTYCNGKKCGYAMRRECGDAEWKVLSAIGPISMGAGVLPGAGENECGAAGDGEMMYMRAKFERVVGSKDSEAFYMMNPDRNGGPELSIYLLRV